MLKNVAISSRSRNLIKQIFLSTVVKGFLFLVTIIQYPILKKILDDDQFGVWSTYLSMFNWFLLFDFGIGHGLKNLLTRELSLSKGLEVRKYATAGFFITGSVFLLFSVLFISSQNLWDYPQLFKSKESYQTLSNSALCMLFVCLLLFSNNTLNTLMNSVQKTSLTYYLSLTVNVFLILIMVFYIHYRPLIPPLEFLASWNLGILAFFFSIAVFLFLKYHTIFIPKLYLLSKKHVLDVLNKGMQFFAIQITILFIYPIDSFLVSNLCSSVQAGRYNIIIKAFSIFIVFTSVVNQSSWPAFTEAYFMKNYEWLTKTFKKINLVSIFVVLMLIPFALSINYITGFWTNVTDFTPLEITSTLLLHIVLIYNFNLTTILYSINSLRSQIVIGVILALLKMTLVFVFKGYFNELYKIQFLTAGLFVFFNLYNYSIIRKEFYLIKKNG